MVMTLAKTVFQLRTLRAYTFILRKASTTTDFSENPIDDDIVDQSWNATKVRHDHIKSLRVAILGLPNVGKSTLINQLVDRPVCATSSKVQTTRVKSDAIYVRDNTQLIMVDTPGLVTNRDYEKLKLEKSFATDPIKSVATADMVGVMQDASHSFKSGFIDRRILVILEQLKLGVPSILILNKVDKVKKKKKLLELVEVLTGEQGWPNFSDVFMVSALQSDGVDDLRNYLLESAKERDWDYESKIFTSDPKEVIIERCVRAHFMDNLPQELPYTLKIQTEHMSVLPDGSISAVVTVISPSDRIASLAMGKSGGRVRVIAFAAEQELSRAFRTTVRLKVAIKFSADKDEQKK